MPLIACGQICSTNDVGHNLAISVQLARDAAAQGATALFLPEASDYISNNAHEGYLLAAPLASHKYALGLQAVAKELGIYISVGIHERPGPEDMAGEAPGSERVFNTHVCISPDGTLKAFYRKLHLFDVHLKESSAASAGESDRMIPGDRVPEPVDMGALGRLGMEICYDIRFPELHTILRRKGADIIAIPAAFTLPTGRAHWYTLVRSIAIAYQVYVVASAQAGAHTPARSSWGQALVFDPWGRELGRLPSIDETADPSKPMPSQFVLAEIDLAVVESVREQIPLAFQKREDVYGVVGRDALALAPTTTTAAEPYLLTRLWKGIQSMLGYGEPAIRLLPSHNDEKSTRY
ncbi:unnamed protein product [Mycena citricolor]|uniref:CN hydrolase domain-containing protein n=1 Tax=Mycena citricolor TaxID=2018698 RepID=A0AAD2H3E5_9AGAR|nr:unnamed protein product [Mycena citricolor]